MPLGADYHNAVLDAMLGDGHTADFPTTLYAALFTADPSYDDSGTEVSDSGTNYARVAVNNNSTAWPDASNGVKTLQEDIVFNQSTASWGLVQWIGFYDTVTVGTGSLVCSSRFAGGPRVNWPDVFTPRISAGTLKVSYWNLSA